MDQSVAAAGAGVAASSDARYEAVLDACVRTRLAQIKALPEPTRSRLNLPTGWWRWAIGGLALVGLASIIAPAKARSSVHSSVPYGADSLVSVDSVGVRASAADLLPPAPAPKQSNPNLSQDLAELGMPDSKSSPMPSPSKAAPHSSAAPSKRGGEANEKQRASREPTPPPERQEEVLMGEDAPSDSAPIMIPPARDLVVNIGSVIEARLLRPVVTAQGGAPVTAEITQAVMANGEVAIAPGSRLVGTAYATGSSDRVQIAVTALVQGGTTMQLHGIVISPDQQVGLLAKVLKKGTGRKRWLGRVIGGAGTVATLGLRSSGVTGGVGGILAEDLAGDAANLERNWANERSDKVLRSEAGAALQVYLQGDFRVSR